MFNRNCILLNLILISCVPFKDGTPDWAITRPISDVSWYGIGSSSESKENYREIARIHSVNEVASQISSSIRSSLKTKRTEDNLNYQEYSEFIIETRVELSLPSVEIIDSYSKDGKYFVLTRLMKADYYKELELKKQKAINTAIDFMTQAVESLTIDSFRLLSESYKEISPYFDLPILGEFPKGSGELINIYPQILILSSRLYNRLKLKSPVQEIQTTIGLKRTHEINITCVDSQTDKPIASFPLTASMGSNLYTEHVITDEQGNAKFNLFKVIERSPVQSFEISPDLSDYGAELNIISLPKLKIVVNAKAPTIHLYIEEKNLGAIVGSPFIMPVLKEMFVKAFSAEFTENKQISDFYISALFFTNAKSKDKNSYGIYQAYADGTIRIYDTASNTEIYQKSINNVMGADFTTLAGAGRNALIKVADNIKNESFAEITINLDNYSSKK
jgi:WD40 repeat protein